MTHDDDGSGLGVLLRKALDDKSTPSFTADQQVARGRRARRVRSSLAGLSTVAAFAVIALVAVTVRGLIDGNDVTIVTPAAPPSTRSTAMTPVTQDTLAATLEDQLGVTFRTVKVQERMRMPSGNPALDLYGSIADRTGDTAFSFGMVGAEAGRLPNCNSTDFTLGSRPPENAYVGTCTSRTLANGTVVIWRSGLAPGGYARSSAMLGRPDGSQVFVESTNQAIDDPSSCVENSSGKHCPITPIARKHPGVTAQALGDLLVALEPVTR
jgi:hypothetical protein